MSGNSEGPLNYAITKLLLMLLKASQFDAFKILFNEFVFVQLHTSVRLKDLSSVQFLPSYWSPLD